MDSNSFAKRAQNLPFYSWDLVWLVLVFLNNKRATMMVVDSKPWTVSSKPKSVNLTSTQSLLEDSGLHFHISRRIIKQEQIKASSKTNLIERNRIFVARTEQDVKLLEKAFADQDKRLFGTLSGFPPTAIDAFVKGAAIHGSDLPSAARKSASYAFALFKFSKAHWKEELKTPQSWARAVKRVNPELYAKYLANIRRGDFGFLG